MAQLRSRCPAPLRAALSLLAATPVLAATAGAQALYPCYVGDAGSDSVWFLADLDGDGDYDGASEAVVFYSDAVGPVALTNNAGIAFAPDGSVWVTDSTEDIVLRLTDSDGDGTAHGAGEAVVWFDGRPGGNASGVVMTSGRGILLEPSGVAWIASANTASGDDAILRLEDLSGDGDANDANEAREYYVIAPGASTGTSIPTAIVRGADGALYYAENGTAGAPPRGIHRLEDLDGSGAIDQPGEVSEFFVPPPQAANAFHWSLSVDAAGFFYLGDSGNDLIWRCRDANGDGVVDPALEATIVWDTPGPSNVWQAAAAPDGSLYCVEDQAPDRLLRLFDADGNGVIDPVSETTEVYSDLVSPNDIQAPTAIVVFARPLDVGVEYCAPAVVNSSGAPATLAALGSASIAVNVLDVECTGLPMNAFGYFLVSRTQGFVVGPGGSQGNLCLGGSIGRYVGQIGNSGPAARLTLDVDLTAIPEPTGFVAGVAGETWHFQCWFRDQNPQVTSNFSSGVSVTLQ